MTIMIYKKKKKYTKNIMNHYYSFDSIFRKTYHRDSMSKNNNSYSYNFDNSEYCC